VITKITNERKARKNKMFAEEDTEQTISILLQQEEVNYDRKSTKIAVNNSDASTVVSWLKSISSKLWSKVLILFAVGHLTAGLVVSIIFGFEGNGSCHNDGVDLVDYTISSIVFFYLFPLFILLFSCLFYPFFAVFNRYLGDLRSKEKERVVNYSFYSFQGLESENASIILNSYNILVLLFTFLIPDLGVLVIGILALAYSPYYCTDLRLLCYVCVTLTLQLMITLVCFYLIFFSLLALISKLRVYSYFNYNAGMATLRTAVTNHSWSEVKLLLLSKPKLCVDINSDGHIPLTLTLTQKEAPVELIQQMLKLYPESVNFIWEYSWYINMTPMEIALQFKVSISVIKTLLSYNSPIYCDHIIWAVSCIHCLEEIVRLLIEFCPAILSYKYSKDQFKTILHFLIVNPDYDMLTVAIMKQIFNINIVDLNNSLPIHYFFRRPLKEINLTLLKEILVMHPSSLKRINNQELTPFQELFVNHEEKEVLASVDTLVHLMLLFNELKLLSSTWIWFIEGSNKVSLNIQMSLTQTLFECSPNNVRDFIYAVDANGRTAINIAAATVVEIMEKFLLFCGRFEIQNLTPLHRSSTSVIYYANDYRSDRNMEQDDEDQERKYNDGNNRIIKQSSQRIYDNSAGSKQGNNSTFRLVILKFMYNYDQFQRELQIREELTQPSLALNSIQRNTSAGRKFNPFIKSITSYSSDGNEEYKEGLLKYSFNFPYCIVMPAAERNLKSIIDSEHIAGKDWEVIYDIAKQISKGLQFLHQHGVIHGDLKPLNIVRINSKYKLIDFDASVRFSPKEQCQYGCVKYSSAYLPPEYLFKHPETKEIMIREVPTSLYNLNKENQLENSVAKEAFSRLEYDLIKASPAHDFWSFGCILYQLFTDEFLWKANGSDNIIEDELEKLYYWDKISSAEDLKKKLLKPSKINDRYRLNLLEQLLSDISFRSKFSIDYILSHSYFNNLIPAVRLPGEEANFDCFLSYRVIPGFDADYSYQLYQSLLLINLTPWYDKECIKIGEHWEKSFCHGLIQSKHFIPIISRRSIQKQFSSFHGNEISIDNVLLEFYLALELKERKLISRICPIFIGDYDENEQYFSDYFASNCLPNCPNVVIKALEKKVTSILEEYCLGTPMLTNNTVANILKLIISNQGIKVAGKGKFGDFVPMIVKQLNQMMSSPGNF
jgi:serine/threonine protein kinase